MEHNAHCSILPPDEAKAIAQSPKKEGEKIKPRTVPSQEVRDCV
jgi:hypothetical protein